MSASRVRTRFSRVFAERRGKAFVSELSRRGVAAQVFDGRSLDDFLLKLEKPAAVFVSHDFRALDVLDAASAAGIRIPDQMVVLGVDDDETFCLAARPSLSSVRTDNEVSGRQAAEIMNKLLKETNTPVSKLAARCGFSNVNSLRNLFRRRYGRSIGEFPKPLRVNGPRSASD